MNQFIIIIIIIIISASDIRMFKNLDTHTHTHTHLCPKIARRMNWLTNSCRISLLNKYGL